MLFFFCKQKTAYEMRISDWSSDVCSSDLRERAERRALGKERHEREGGVGADRDQRAVREVRELEDPVAERQADRAERDDPAQPHAPDRRREQTAERRTPRDTAEPEGDEDGDEDGDRKSVVTGTSVQGRVNSRGHGII